MDTPLAWYTTREAVKAALDVETTARSDREVDRCIAAASRTVEGALHRRFYPWLGTRYFDWPAYSGSSYRVDFHEHTLLETTTVTSGGVALAAANYLLEPINSGPPYDSLELDLGDGVGFTSGATFQRDIAILGLWGHQLDERAVGVTAEALDGSETDVDVVATVSSAVGIGSIIRIGSERMTVTGRRQLDTTQNTGGNLTAVKSNVTVPVTDGSGYDVGEVITVDSERMLVVDIAGNNLTVQRAWDGTVLATHTTGADIYAPRTLVVRRGDLGTTAASALTAATVYLWHPPALVDEFTVAQTVVYLGQRQAGYARTVGTGESERETSGRGLTQIAKEARAAYGRFARSAAV